MNTAILVKLRMEGQSYLVLVFNPYYPVIDLSAYLHLRGDSDYHRSPYEGHGDAAYTIVIVHSAKAAKLPAVSVAAYGYRQRAKVAGTVILKL